jgi:hypothetical protein
MAYRTIRTTTRTDTDTPFFRFEWQIQNYINDTYVITGKRIASNVTLSQDGLQQIVTSTWVDLAAYNEFMADQQIVSQREAVVAYNLAHNITSTWDNAEIV